MLRRWDRIQHAIIESFPPIGARPTPIWNLHELEPDDEQRAYLQRKIARIGASEHDFLRWRNACVAYSLRDSLDALRTPDRYHSTLLPTPLWVTNHLLRRKVYTPYQASFAVHIALVAVPGSGPLASGDEQTLLLALELVSRYHLTYALPALISRILALPTKHHDKLLTTLSKRDLPSSPLTTASLQMVLDDINQNLVLLPNEIWQSVWEKWVIIDSLGDDFAASLRLQIRDQGFQVPYYRRPATPKSYTQTATNFLDRTTPSRQDPSLAALTAAAYSKQVSARLLLGVASTLADGFFLPHPNQRKTKPTAPSVTFLTALILGLIRKGAYSRAVGVWQRDQASDYKIGITPKLLEAAASAYILNGNLEEAVKLLDRHAKWLPKPRPGTDDPVQPLSKLVTLLITHLPVSAQGIVFRQAYERWRIQPDSEALETIMVRSAQAAAKRPRDELDLRRNMRELRAGFKSLFRRTPTETELPEPTIFSPGPFNKWHAINLFQKVLRNWPFIQGVEQGYWKGLLEKHAIELFIPPRLAVGPRAVHDTNPSFEFTPSPLHPSPIPSFAHACPTRKAWTAYLSLLDPEDLPQALEWMRSVDEFLHLRRASAGTPLDLFRPERAAMIDVLMRWEDLALANETPVGRAWEERKTRTVGGIGREGALRAWLVEWLGDEYVPSRSEIARARMEVGDLGLGAVTHT